MAVGQGFEPREGVNPRRFSRPLQSTTLPAHHQELPEWTTQRMIPEKPPLSKGRKTPKCLCFALNSHYYWVEL